MTLHDILSMRLKPDEDEEDDGPDDSQGGGASPAAVPPPPVGVVAPILGPPAPKPVKPVARIAPPPLAAQVPVIAPDGNHPGLLGHLRDILTGQPGGLYNDQPIMTADGQQTVRTPTTTGSVMNALGNIIRPAIAGAAHQNIAGGGPKDWFAAAAAGAQANDAHAAKQRKLADDARAKQIEDFEISRQQGTDARLQGASDEKAVKDAATAKENATRDQENADSKSDANYLKATSEMGAKNVDPDIAKYLDGKADSTYTPPMGFNRATYDKVGGRWLQFPGITPKAQAQKSTLNATLARAGFKVNDDGDTVPLTPAEMSGVQNSTVNRNNAAAGNSTAQAGLAFKRTSNEDRALDLRSQMAATAMRNAATNEQRQALAKDKFGLDYTGQTADGSIILRDPDTGQIIVPKVEANREKLPAAAQAKISQAGAMIDAGARLKQQARALAANGKMGAISGSFPEMEAKIGTADPDVKEFLMGVKNMSTLAPMLHGTRGVQLAHDIENGVGSLRQSPESFIAAINAMQDTSNDLINSNSVIHRPGVPSARPLTQPPAAVPPPAVVPPNANVNPALRGPAVAAPPAPLAHDTPPPQPSTFSGMAGYAMRDPVSGAIVNKKADRAKKYEALGWKYVY